MLSQENQRLGGGVQETEQMKRKLREEYARLEREYKVLGEENEDVRRRVVEYENKIGLLSQEVQRLNEVLRNLTSDK